MLNSTGGLSWIGTACLPPRDAERELVVLREQPVLDKDLVEKRTRTRQYSHEIEGEKRPWRSPSPTSALLPTTQVCLAPYRRLTTDQVIEKCQEEAMALHQALADKPNYRLAQRSMYNLGDLEVILWEAFSKESFATAQAETKKLKRDQVIERASLEARLKERENQLLAGCKRQANALRKEYQVRLASTRATVQGASTAEESSTANASANSADTSTESLDHPEKSTLLQQQQLQTGVIQRQKHNRLIGSHERLRDESMRLLSVRNHRALHRLSERRHVETRRRKEELRQCLVAVKGEVARAWRTHNRSRGITVKGLEKPKSAERVETRRRKEELRQCLVAVKGEVARAWRTHNRSRGITVKGFEKPKSVERVETPAESFKLEASPASADMAAAPIHSGLPKKEVLTLHHRVAMEETTVIAKPEMGLMDTNHGCNLDLLTSPNLGQQEAGGSYDVDQDQDFGDANVGDSSDGALSNVDHSVRSCQPRKENGLAKPSSPETRTEDTANTERLLQNNQVSIDRVEARDLGETSLGQGEADARLQSQTTDGEDIDDVITGMSSGGSSSSLGSPKSQHDEAGRIKSGTCTSDDAAKGGEPAKHSKNATSMTRQRGGTVYRKKRQGAEVVTGCSIPTLPKAEVIAPVGVLGSVIGVLSPAEANALLTLGRNAQEGPDVLLTSPAGPLERWAKVVERGDVQDGKEVVENSEDDILDRAVDKLVAEIIEKQNLTRKRLGMAPIIF